MKKGIITLSVFLSVVLYSPYAMCYASDVVQNPPPKSTIELYQDIIVSLLMPQIDKQIDSYYTKEYKYSPTVYPYQVTFLDVKRLQGYRSFIFSLSIRTQAVVGPHIDVGLDHMTFEIHGGGHVQLKKFEHIRSYELPPHWQHYKK
ncbi:DUF3888 domain-containing protein [Alicyclobacillus fastidiosus]|uniref:DUF3888 domain-containing protein n=1 Tax=Alicyclobacillus fastidiosus TaxID=392011 RepID=A0ABV5AJX0_9BACL|nr:DUF3888 domain-containing protein [Alicyclobacillus fastidiosus]WEH09072.1 DUF3888 domain-containing protein [Alicyclobacillus fastidiosus]